MFQQNITSPTPILSGWLQRLSANFGFNSSPTSFEFDIVTENDQTFDFNGAYPGKLLSFTLGNLKFGGIIQSWTENFGAGGKTYSLRTSDPRLIFNNIILSLDGRGLSTGVVLDNYLNVFQYYGSPQAADSTKDGMTFSKIREYLSTTGVINAYGSKFQLQFTSGFLDASGAVNPSGIPYWYRINTGETSLDQLLQQVSQDFGMDYYAEVDYNTFNPTGTLNTLWIKHVYRNILSDATEISGFVLGARNSGVMLNYKRGQELRTDPTTVVALGPALEYWKFPQGSQIKCYWGRTNDGTAITTDTTDNYGIILLDHITGSGSQYIASTVSVPSITITKSSSSVYPPTITKTSTNINVSGYQANINVMRAALYSQESWEEALFKESPTFAAQIGITRDRFLDYTSFLTVPTGIRQAITLGVIGSGITDRSNVIQELIKLVYDATRQTVDQYWGKSWLLQNIETSQWLNNGSYDSSELIPRIEFGPASFAWSEPNRGLPSGVTLNHSSLTVTNNSKFRNEIGKLASFVSIPNYNTRVDNTNFPYPIDLSDISRESFIIDQGNKLVLPLNVEQYEKTPTSFIVSIDFPIQGITNGSGYNDKRYYYDFLRYVGYSDQDIRRYNLMQNANDNQQFGLASPRPFGLPYSSDVYGFFIGIVRNEQNFGGFIASGNRPGGCRLITDESLAPWTYGSLSGFNTAGNVIAGRATSSSTVIDSADLSIAGLPPYNLGDAIGASAQITSATCQFGPDGFSTNYSIRTFATPKNQLSKVLFDRISNVYTQLAYQKKQIVNLNKVQKEEETPLLTPSQINSVIGKNKKGPTTTTNDSSFKTNVVIPAPSGFYLDGNNPTIIYV